jgi:hypothetical protein
VTQELKQRRVEWLRRQVGALRSRLAILPQLAQSELGPLLDDLEAQLDLAGGQRGEMRRLLDELRAIDKCVRFELAVSRQEVSGEHLVPGARRPSLRRLNLVTTAELHAHRLRLKTETAAHDA